LRANNITNSIYSILNEDKFSKYTAQQIYDELGEEEFQNYLEKLVLKAAKDIKLLDGLAPLYGAFEIKPDEVSLLFRTDDSKIFHQIQLSYYPKNGNTEGKWRVVKPGRGLLEDETFYGYHSETNILNNLKFHLEKISTLSVISKYESN
jgi:hypothetical protein